MVVEDIEVLLDLIWIISKERTGGGLNKGGNLFCPLIQPTFGFSELNKVASGMGIQCPLLLTADCCSGYFQVLFLKNFPSLGHTPPLPPDFMSYIRLFQGQALLLLGARPVHTS